MVDYTKIMERKVLSYRQLDTLIPFLTKSTGLFSPIIKRVLDFFENFFNIKIFIGIPDGLDEFDPKAWKTVALAYKLKQRKIISYLTREVTEKPDEIRIIRFKIKMVAGANLRGDAHGYHMSEEKEALESGIKNALKLYSLHRFSPKASDCIDAQFKETPEIALNLNNVEGISKETRAKGLGGFKLNFNNETGFRWTRGISLTQNKQIWIPMQLVNATYQRTHNEEPILRLAGIAGMGAGETKEDAILEGMIDLIERDASMITWLNKLSPVIIDNKTIDDNNLKKIIKKLRIRKLRSTIVILPTDFPLNIVSVILTNQRGNSLPITITSGADTNLNDAIYKAFLKALAIGGSSIKNSILKKFEETRLSESFQPHSSPDIANLGRRGRMFFWARREMMKNVRFLLKGERRNAQTFKDCFTKGTDKKTIISSLVKIAKEKSYEVAYVDMAPKRIRGLGMHLVSIIIPELQPMHSEESIPYLSGKRLKSVPELLGYKVSGEVNKIPHPFYT